MEPKVTVKMVCPKCGLPIEASIDSDYRDFLLYICPKCHSNVVYYDNKLDVITNRLVRKLIYQRKLTSCGMVRAPDIPQELSEKNYVPESASRITKDAILDLKILLENSKDSSDLISKL